jgi:hypothetical protein
MENKIIEYAIERRTDPAGYVERALASASDAQCPPEIRARLTQRLAEYRARRGGQPADPEAGAAFDITPEQARLKALVAALAL